MWELFLKHYPTISLVFIILLSVFTIVRIIMDTNNSAKTMAYILLVFLFPIGGAVIYFAFGVNYRRRKLFSKKIILNEDLFTKIEDQLSEASLEALNEGHENIKGNEDLIRLLLKDSKAPLSYNKVKLLINGEEKFAAVLQALESAELFIHMEYYIFDDDEIGNKIINLLKVKAQQGVTVRFIYDDFGSHGLADDTIATMKDAGIQVFPFFEVKFYLLANRINYRDHRKIIIVDGLVGFTGGINVSDRYINDGDAERLYWRDTHVMIEGPAVNSLQYHFIANWNFCTDETLEINRMFFPNIFEKKENHEDLVQIIAGGPDYPTSGIMLSFFTAIVNAKERVFITSPYFVPNESIYDALKKAALSGKDTRLLLPGISDSKIVNAAARSYFKDLLACGVRIFLYQKGFIHAKTIVVDDNLSMVGSANMDARSFDLNFEINAVVYSKKICKELNEAYLNDINYSVELSAKEWEKRAWWRELFDDIARLLSPLL
ncbi:MAG: cardiolipin synthase [Taibaiella sp.]|jgi:cardiolipin synthase